MPSPGAPVPPRLPVEDSYLELLADTLESLDLPARGQFLQRYIRAITHLDLRETQCIQLWDEMLSRRRELSENLGRPVALKTALMDVLASAGLKKALRTSDSAFRIGGDEFALLLPQTDAGQALALSRRVETVFAKMLQPLQL